MAAEKKFGLIGKNIGYTFSQKYFTKKFRRLMLENYSYEIFDLENLENIEDIFQTENLVGLNITIPYKEKIIEFLDEISPEAAKIGAVNTIHLKDGKKIGFNTDVTGFAKTLNLINKNHLKSALILGNGGAAKAVAYVLQQKNIPFETVSRSGELNFENLSKNEVQEHSLIIQCTPVGTFPHVENCLQFPFDGLSDQHSVIDLIYNPSVSTFLKKSGDQGAETFNGLYMLEQQAEKAWQIWNAS